ncbi:RTA1 like protein [Colletotrichum tofieldiae]|uniref:RTA1 like protein n=1 Tax=Colletotrichum tofieldiae TaxID=708197 RepID=A0A166WUD3_9PEZI|nr:RTA1 like protein [Colletotrichum tofieldiae]GKT54247.1 RTA1 like protein [Colletotrichum tofieldiae]
MSTNDTFVPSYETCDEVTDQCPIELTVYGTYLSKPAATFFGIAFGACLLFQLYFGIRSRTWSFIIWLGIGTIFEVFGYWARTKLADNPWDLDAFAQQYLTLLLAPTLVAAAISVTFKHIVIWYGAQWSVLRPSLYPWVFVGTDFLSIIIQVAGGAITAAKTSGSGDETMSKIGEKLVIGGVAFQVANMFCCGCLMLIYAMRRWSALRPGAHSRDTAHLMEGDGQPMCRASASDGEARRVRAFVYALAVAYIAILIRCSYRIAENIPAITLNVLRNEPLFLGLDGAMILIAIGAVTVFHPYLYFPFLKESKHLKKRSKHQGDYRMQDMS